MILDSLEDITLREEKSQWAKSPCQAWWFEHKFKTPISVVGGSQSFNFCTEICESSTKLTLQERSANARDVILPFGKAAIFLFRQVQVTATLHEVSLNSLLFVVHVITQIMGKQKQIRPVFSVSGSGVGPQLQ